MKKKSIKKQLMFSLGGLIFNIYAIILSVIIWSNYNASLGTAVELSVSKSEEVAKEISQYFQHSIDASKNIRTSFLSLKKHQNKNRDFYNEILYQFLATNDNFLSVWSMWEENTLDNNDNAYMGVHPYDETGRYDFSYYKDNGKYLLNLMKNHCMMKIFMF